MADCPVQGSIDQRKGSFPFHAQKQRFNFKLTKYCTW